MSSPKMKEAMAKTLFSSLQNRFEFVTPELLLLHITEQPEFQTFCKQQQLDVKGLRANLEEYVETMDRFPNEKDFVYQPSSDFTRMVEMVKGFDPITPTDIVEAVCSLDDSYGRYLLCKHLGEDTKQWFSQLDDCYTSDIKLYHQEKNREKNGKKVIAEAWVNGKKIEIDNPFDLISSLISGGRSLLPSNQQSRIAPEDDRIENEILIGDDLSEMDDDDFPSATQEPWQRFLTHVNKTYREKNPLIGRTTELERTIRVLCRRDKNNVIFIGEPGVGKTALIYGLARMIEETDEGPTWLHRQQIYALDMTSLIAGTSFHGEYEKRMKEILEGAKRNGNCILYIDEIHSIMGSNGSNNTTNAAEILKPYLEDGTVRFIGSTTYQDYNRQIASNHAIARRFQIIDIKEPSTDETIRIIQGLQGRYEQHHGVRFTDEAIRYAVEQSHALIHDRFLPDKAIDLIDEAGAYRQQYPLLNKKGMPKQSRFQKVDKEVIQTILTDVCRISAKALKAESNEELQHLDSRITGQIYGQDEAVRQVVRSVMMAKAGLSDPEKPLASLLFVGPTGVGKTEVCRVLAQELGVELVRFDMSEYAEKHTISKLIGSPAGYVGYDEGGLLTEAIRKSPNCVLLLDEIEKAHSDIYNILLQVMDYGRLTDNKGNKADFRQVMLIMTSNAGAQYAGQASVGFGGGMSRGEAMLKSVKKTFKPEFLNRLSGTVVFRDMDEQMARLVMEKKLKQLEERLASKNVTLDFSDEALELLLSKGFVRQFGAREMDRAIQQYLVPPLMESILFGQLKKGGKAHIGRQQDQLIIAPRP